MIWRHRFTSISVSSDGSFSRQLDDYDDRYITYDGPTLDGVFFGKNHREIAGTYTLPSRNVLGSFGGIKD